ncbi:exopolysaccharide biosynthesis polyprenyl glycosylphosphotransferase [Streptomyces griseoviridis]|uniref:Transferase n=1 Tax=Streptomyces griseoviridis TaxID=45398 RepID=A0A918G5C0_STRGD|nr:exopolysaccharide biosynthesis polyprenyl glycosylphosphotransferase [Streptomyces niveoruber]GGS17866.1 transferase [Streptomyces niveoruber]
MTAESTVPSPAGQPDLGGSPVSVLPPRTSPAPLPFPAGRPAPPAPPAPSPLPLLLADTVGALTGALALVGVSRPPLFAALLVAFSLLLRPSGGGPAPGAGQLPGVLDELPALSARTAVAWLALAALAAAYDPRHALAAPVLLLGFAAQTAAGCAARGAVRHRRRRALRARPRAALVVGPAATARQVAAALLRDRTCGVRPVGIVTDAPDGGEGPPVLPPGDEALRAVVRDGVRDVLVVRPVRQGPSLRALAESGCAVWELDAEPPGAPAPHGWQRLAGFRCRRLSYGGTRTGGARKRALDLTVSGALLLLAGPLLLACAAGLRVSAGPGVLFRQERVGRHGRPFTLLKFRTHRPADAHEAATRWSVADEQRMPRFCRFLRRTSLDELPQLWNVFRGDMSLVGPRPERPYFVAQFSQSHPGYAARHRMPVGLTGLAQVKGLRGDTSIEDRARHDNAYIDDWSLWRDVCILLRTAVALVRPTGS